VSERGRQEHRTPSPDKFAQQPAREWNTTFYVRNLLNSLGTFRRRLALEHHRTGF
jgi:hypothetical protein